MFHVLTESIYCVCKDNLFISNLLVLETKLLILCFEYKKYANFL